MNMRVLMISQYASLHHGGAERYMAEVTSRLVNQGINLRHLSAEDPSFSHPWGIKSGGIHPRWMSELDQLLQAFNPNVLYVHLTVPALAEMAVLCASRKNIPSCVMYHGDVTGVDLFRRTLGRIYVRTLGDAVIKSASIIGVHSLYYKNQSLLLKNYAGKVYVAPPGVDPIFLNGQRTQTEPYILFVGKLNLACKGFNYLYQAWKTVREYRPNLALWAVGEGDSASYPGVRHLGYINDDKVLANLYASALVTVLPSVTSSESFGMVLGEALVAGCPIIGTDAGGSRTLIEQSINGYCVKARSVQSLTDALFLLEHTESILRTNIARKSRKYLTQFSWDAAAASTLSAFEMIKSGAC